MRFGIAAAALFLAAMLRAASPDALTCEQFQAAIESTIVASGLDVGVAIEDLTSGDEFLVHPDVVYPQGSSIRIHLVTELFRQSAAGKLSVDEVRRIPQSAITGGTGVLRFMHRDTVSMSLRDYAVLMIAANDHSAANFLTDVVGMENVNASLAEQGTPEIKFRRRAVSRRESPELPENEGTPRAVMRALALIYAGKVVDRATSNAILDVLGVSEMTYFHRPIPWNVRFAGRSGSGPEMRCDAGIVLLPGRPYVLCIMIKSLGQPVSGPRDYGKADALLGSITRLAHRQFSALPPGPARDVPKTNPTHP